MFVSLEGLGVKVTHGDTTIEIKDLDGKKQTTKGNGGDHTEA